MIVVSDEVWSALFRFGGIKTFGLIKVNATRGIPQPQGIQSVSPDTAEIQEWAIATEFERAVVARKVMACGRTICWLRRDLADHAEAALAAEHVETERMRGVVTSMVERDRKRRAEAERTPKPLPSPELIHAAMRHSARIGRLHDMNSRGDEERGKFALLLERLEHERHQS